MAIETPLLLHFLTRGAEPDKPSITIDGQPWVVCKERYAQSREGPNAFTCISYSWGKGRMPSPLDKHVSISDQTIPALKSAIRARPDRARFWLDAFCVPSHGDARRVTLASMGLIYSVATEVITVLSPAAQAAIEQMKTATTIDESAISDLENEQWVSRAWTYQEIVNSRAIFFTCLFSEHCPADETNSSRQALIDYSHFLNCIGHSLTRLPGTDIDKSRMFPRLEAFQELIADYMVAGYQERSALQVMAGMDRRTQERAEDHFYAMIGAVSKTPPSLSVSKNACEEFMAVCERKGDFSFIFSATERETARGKRWRPSNAGDLPSLLPWHIYGESQPGQLRDDVLFLDLVVELEMGRLDDDVLQTIEQLPFVDYKAGDGKPSIDKLIHECLMAMGFQGRSECLSTKSGFFFPCRPVLHADSLKILVSATLRWRFGAPGLACERRGQDVLYTPGVFIGKPDVKMATTVGLS